MGIINAERYFQDQDREFKYKEIEKWVAKIKEQGYTIIPLSVYTKQRLVKMEIGLAKGKKLHDKREALKRKDQERDMKKVQKDFGR